MTHIGNLYSIDGPLEEIIPRDLWHFRDKHGDGDMNIVILMNPSVAVSKILDKHLLLHDVDVSIIADPTQGKASYMIVRREDI